VDSYVAALLEERAACETTGKVDNVKQIDAELARLGYGFAAEQLEPEANPEPKPAPKRRGRPRKTDPVD
jgi:hypothetical protein